MVVASGAGRGEHTLVGDGLVFIAVVLYGAYLAIARGASALPPRAVAPPREARTSQPQQSQNASTTSSARA